MRQHAIRHLPVLQHGHLVGIITDSDIRLVLPSPGDESGGVGTQIPAE